MILFKNIILHCIIFNKLKLLVHNIHKKKTPCIIYIHSLLVIKQCTLFLIVDHLRVGPPQAKVSKTSKPKVFVTNGRDTPLRGVALVFTKVAEADVTITETNIMKVNSHE